MKTVDSVIDIIMIILCIVLALIVIVIYFSTVLLISLINMPVSIIKAFKEVVK